MILNTEQHLYEFLKKILQKDELNKYRGGLIDYDINLYRGFLPTNDFANREKGEKTNDYFPFVLLRINNFSQKTIGINSYLVPVNVEIWIGTKEEKESDYIKNLAIGDYIRQRILTVIGEENGFIMDVEKEFKVEFFSDRQDPFFYSQINFTVYGEAVEPLTEVEEKWI